ncbi:MAG: sugar ABC transporter permease [Caldilineaceae bacterium]|nr:sugar ABC transporter permease [Caldilineaceae bacterium]
MTTRAAVQQNGPRVLWSRSARGQVTYFWFLVPCIVLLGTLSLIPLVVTFYLSLQKMSLIYPDATGFFGAGNYARMAGDQYFWLSIRTTLILIIGPVAVQMALGLLLALLLHNDMPILRISRSLFIAPMVIPPVIAGLIWKVLFIPNLGGLNFLLEVVGIPGPMWLETPGWAIFSVGLVAVWQDTPFVMLLLLAALESMPQEPVEAARVDGASAVQVFRYITFPYLVPTLMVALLFRIINSLAIFPIIYVLTQGGPGRATEMLNYYTFINAFQYLDIGYGATLAMALFALVVLLSLVFMRLRMQAIEMVE